MYEAVWECTNKHLASLSLTANLALWFFFSSFFQLVFFGLYSASSQLKTTLTAVKSDFCSHWLQVFELAAVQGSLSLHVEPRLASTLSAPEKAAAAQRRADVYLSCENWASAWSRGRGRKIPVMRGDNSSKRDEGRDGGGRGCRFKPCALTSVS